jgi:opacity protein-like surface antigen
MSKLAIAIGCATLAVTGAVFAGGVDTYSAPAAAPAQINNYMYAHLNVAYALHAWRHSFGVLSTGETWKNPTWAFGYGADVGYHFMPHLAVEAGYYRFLNSKVTQGTSTYTFKSSAAYLALRGDFNVMQNLDLFAKLGWGMQLPSVNNDFHTANPGYSIKSVNGVMFGAGADYNVGNNIDVDLQYMHFAGNTSNLAGTAGVLKRAVPALDMVTVGVGYKFAM